MSGALNILMAAGHGKPFEVNMSPSSIYQEGTGITITTTQTAGVTVVGGTGPFTYAWTDVVDNIYPTDPNLSATKFTTFGMGPGDERQGSFSCLVTDTATGLINGALITVTIRRV